MTTPLGVTDPAVSSSSTHNAMIIAVAPVRVEQAAAGWLSLLGDGTWTSASNGLVPALAGPVSARAAGVLYWYGWTQRQASKNNLYSLTVERPTRTTGPRRRRRRGRC